MCVRLYLCLCGGDGLRHGERSEQVVLGGGGSWECAGVRLGEKWKRGCKINKRVMASEAVRVQ